MINENQLHNWVQSNERKAQGVIAELIGRLVAASIKNPTARRFPAADSIGQSGEDGYIDTETGFHPFIPKGKSIWEFGTGSDSKKKATLDYKKRTKATDESIRKEAAFIFVSPHSAAHGWDITAQRRWIQKRHDWNSVNIIDGTVLIDWLGHFPSVERWLARQMGISAEWIETPSERWNDLRSIGSPPYLNTDLFLANRHAARAKLDQVFAGDEVSLRVDTHYPSQLGDVVAAYIATLEDNFRREIEGRCLILKSVDAWNDVSELVEPHIFVAEFDAEEHNDWLRLLERAKTRGHGVVFPVRPGGQGNPHRVPLPEPREHQILDALRKAGYTEGHAYSIAQRCSGNLNLLLSSLSGLSPVPKWADQPHAAELAIAELLGGWDEKVAGDIAVAEALSRTQYHEWISKNREIASRPNGPLKQHNGKWHFISRYEGWYALGHRIFEDHLDLFKTESIKVLRERDPALELPREERYLAEVRGKVWTHSARLRTGLAESVALLGSHPQALTSVYADKAEGTARWVVHSVLKDADWQLWASLDDTLPLLAEAAPREFLDAVETALNSEPCPLEAVFAQESNAFGGSNYMTGLLWALETLAWGGDHLAPVVLLLGALAEKDPGGNWGNRPANSLATILLPWFPQTAASLEKRIAAVKTLLSEHPKAGWQLLLDLLPQSHQTSMMTRKPAWRTLIPDTWREGATVREYREQIEAYTGLAVEVAQTDLSRLSELVRKIDQLSSEARTHLLSHLASPAVSTLPQDQRLLIWTNLIEMVSRHRKFEHAEWALNSEVITEMAQIAAKLAPNSATHRHQRLFTDRDFDLYEETDNFEDEMQKLLERRQEAVRDVYAEGGISAILEFINTVKAPLQVGIAFGAMASEKDDTAILPGALQTESPPLTAFIAGYIFAKFRHRSWDWIDNIDVSAWSVSEKAQLLGYLPFSPDTWKHAAEWLRQDESVYWSKAGVNPFDAEGHIELAIERLLDVGRVREAIDCIARTIFRKQPVNTELCLRALLMASQSEVIISHIEGFEITKIIEAMQNDLNADPANVTRAEWAFMPLLDGHHEATPKFLEQNLADDPAFFCEVIRMIFRSKNVESAPKADHNDGVATNAYRLLMNWKTPPGKQLDGSFDGEALQSWLQYVKESCSASGHLDIALQRLGHVLHYSPADPDGLWMHRSVAEVLNGRDHGQVRRGFEIEIYNSRGAHAVDPKGGPERELAKLYRKKAEDMEMEGYTRLATTLRETAAGYEREAEHNIVTAKIEDDG